LTNSGQKVQAPLLPKISDAIAQFIKPITTNAQSNRPQLFERFTAPRDGEDKSKNESDSESAPKNQSDPRPPDNVIPLRAENSVQLRAAHLGSGFPFVGLLTSLADSRKLLLGIGKRLYARMRRENDKRKARKGVILDIKA
jgi:hypothetical protein